MQQRVYQTKVYDMEDLRQRLIDVWAGMQPSVIDDADYSGASVSMPAFAPEEDTLNTHCDLWNSKYLLALVNFVKIYR